MEKEKKIILLFSGALVMLYVNVYLDNKEWNETEKEDRLKTFLLGLSSILKLYIKNITPKEINEALEQIKEKHPEEVLEEIKSLLDPKLKEDLVTFATAILCFSRDEQLLKIINFLTLKIFENQKTEGTA